MNFIELLNQKEIYIFCRNIRGMIISYWFRKMGVLTIFLDNDVSKQNTRVFDFDCINPVNADKNIPCVIAAESDENRLLIKKQLVELNFLNIVSIDEKWEKEWLDSYSPWLSDEEYLKLFYAATVGEEMDINHPKNFNEKIQWLKINDRNPKYKKLVDKYEVKGYVSEIIGSKYIIPTIGVYKYVEEIDFKNLPDSFVIKCTHDS